MTTTTNRHAVPAAHVHGPWCDHGAQCKVLELTPAQVVRLADLTIPPGAVVFSEGHHRHTCWACSELLDPCACDLRNRIDFCGPCYAAMCEEWAL